MAGATGRAERIELLDALRGFALFGILLANILYWSGWGLMTDGQRLELGGADTVTWQYRFHHLFVDGKFYTIFSLLFGAGFALQISRLTRKGEEGMRLYRRRILVLLAIGLVHSWLIWDGDILTLYALLGLLLPWFHSWRDRSLLLCAAVLIFLVPLGGILLFSSLGWKPQDHLYSLSFAIAENMGANTAPDAGIEWLRREDFMGWLSWVLSGTPFSWGLRIETWRIPKVLGIMLIGIVVGRGLAAGTLIDDRRLLRRVMLLGLAVGAPVSLFYALRPAQGQQDWPSIIGTVPLALAYAAAFTLLWKYCRPFLQHLAPVGRMALTNYLTHSVLGIILFYGIGFGLVGRLEPVSFYGVALLIFAAQLLFSKWWLSGHEQGPVEAFWRRASYGRRPTQLGMAGV
ncbi:MAG: DUF418 domain-containing protein [Sphingosinicella sp.]|nr:DUF418 domain-containing protein [Sphingosinicella sp.]